MTCALQAASPGDRQAAADLVPLPYGELRKLAAVRVAAEAPGHSLDAKALTHEAYLHLVGDQRFDGRGHFFAAALKAMRRFLVERVRAKQTRKRGDGRARVQLDPDRFHAAEFGADRGLGLDEALHPFATISPAAAEPAKLRAFGRLSVEEAGEALAQPRASAFRTWTVRAWLTAYFAWRRERG